MSDVTSVISRVKSGNLSIAEAARIFAARKWPQSQHANTAITAQEQDLSFPPDPPGSFSEVAAAYSAGDITRAQYAVLARAASMAMKKQRQ